MSFQPERVLITGMSVLSPFGVGLHQMWSGLSENQCGLGPIRGFDSESFPCGVAGELPVEFSLEDHLPRKLLSRMDPVQALSTIACGMALEHSEINLESVDSTRFGVSGGTCFGSTTSLCESVDRYHRGGWRSISPHTGPRTCLSGVAAWPAIHHGLQGPNQSLSLACSSGNAAVANAFTRIRQGHADRMLAVAADLLHPTSQAVFQRIRGLAKAPEPGKEPRILPFSRNRTGTVLSEGAAAILLERESVARARGATIHGELLGFGESCDAFHMAAPRSDGQGVALAIRSCLQHARLSSEQIDLVSAHGSGTVANDAAEVRGIKTALGGRAHQIPVIAPKSQLGHTMGASALVETIAALVGSREGVVTPTLHLDEADPECDLDHVPNRARPAPYSIFLNLSSGFGGQNVALAARGISSPRTHFSSKESTP